MAKDSIHWAVRIALEKEGWLITDDPLEVETGGVALGIDLAAEKFLLAERKEREIAVEIKSFGSRSLVYDFHLAMGQYINYRGALRDEGIERELFLCVAKDIFEEFEQVPFYFRRIRENGVKLLVVNIFKRKVFKWIS